MPAIDDFADAMRYLNLMLALTALGAIGASWRELTRISRADFFWRTASGLFAVAIALASEEGLRDPDPPPGMRTYAATIALCWVIYATWLERRDTPTARHETKDT